jgi:hypothetical protein
MNKEEILKKIFETPFEKLVPSYVFSSEVVNVTEEEFYKLMRHKKMDYTADFNDTFVIGEYVFKKEKKKIININ